MSNKGPIYDLKAIKQIHVPTKERHDRFCGTFLPLMARVVGGLVDLL